MRKRPRASPRSRAIRSSSSAAAWSDAVRDAVAERTQQTLAFHPPCTLQHGMQIRGEVERLLRDAGYTLVPVADAHLCCGSAGTYSILQAELAGQLKSNKLCALEAHHPDVIATANIGCMTHLQSGTRHPDTPLDRADRHREPPVRRARPPRMIGRHEIGRGEMTAPLAPAFRSAYPSFLAIPTRWMDNDAYGHVNNVTYYSYFDTLVNEHLVRAGGTRHSPCGIHRRRR